MILRYITKVMAATRRLRDSTSRRTQNGDVDNPQVHHENNKNKKQSSSDLTNKKNGYNKKDTTSASHQLRKLSTYKNKKSNNCIKLVSKTTWQAAGVLLVAIVTSVVYNHIHDEHLADPAARAFMTNFCQSNNSSNVGGRIFCHAALKVTQRTHTATRTIPQGQTILEIPRQALIWDLDAMRNDFVRRELLPALERHETNKRSVKTKKENVESQHTASSILAAYIAIMRQNKSAPTSLLQTYIDFLPTYEDFAGFHPITWSDEELSERLGIMTTSFEMIMSFKSMIEHEYDKFANASSTFANKIERKDYIAARLSVMTRSFGTGPLPETDEWDNERQELERQYQINFSKGCHAMVPILDMYQHHANPNVGFQYDHHKNAFVVSTVSTINPGFEIIDQYGRHSDSHLFAKYGFVNGDGSGHVQTSIALWHRIITAENSQFEIETIASQQKLHMLKYLQYDDGYSECVGVGVGGASSDGSNQELAWQLKQLKYKYLCRIANLPQRWIALLPPRNPNAKSGISIDEQTSKMLQQIPQWNPKSLRFDGSAIFSTCRVISLTHFDYNGTALRVLRDAYHDLEMLPPTPDSLEYRTLTCIARMTSIAINRFPLELTTLETDVYLLNTKSYKSIEWILAHVQLGELQALQAIRGVALSGLRRFGQILEGTESKGQKHQQPAGLGNNDSFFIRSQPCSFDHVSDLLDLV